MLWRKAMNPDMIDEVWKLFGELSEREHLILAKGIALGVMLHETRLDDGRGQIVAPATGDGNALHESRFMPWPI